MAGDQPTNRLGRFDAVRRGMSAAEVRQLVGPSARVTRLILFRRSIEQWHYEELSGQIEFAHPRGEEPYVLGVHSRDATRAP
jgi:hypothetical protein